MFVDRKCSHIAQFVVESSIIQIYSINFEVKKLDMCHSHKRNV